MNRLQHIISAALLLSAVSASAQTPDKLVDDVMKAAQDACVVIEYALSAKVDDADISDWGTVVAQDDLWYLKGQAIEIYTSEDGTWIMHVEAKEAIVEPKWTYADMESFYRSILSNAGNDVKVEVKSKVLKEKNQTSCFVPKIDSDWIVTDLR